MIHRTSFTYFKYIVYLYHHRQLRLKFYVLKQHNDYDNITTIHLSNIEPEMIVKAIVFVVLLKNKVSIIRHRVFQNGHQK